MYYILTKYFNTFTTAKILVDQDINVIDGTIQALADKYIMFIKDESLSPVQKNIKIACADHITVPYSALSDPITGAYWAEGPTVLRNGDQWIVYFDKYKEGKFGAVCSTNLKDWTDISGKISLPEGLRHGTILEVSESILLKLKKLSK